MRTRSGLLAAVSAVAVSMAASMASASLVIPNGNFETGDLTGWTGANGASVVAGAGVGGSYGLHVATTPNWTTAIAMNPGLSVTDTASDYTFSFDVKTTNTATATWDLVRRTDGQNWQGATSADFHIFASHYIDPGFTNNINLTDTNWHTVSLTLPGAQVAGFQFSLVSMDTATPTDLYFDNFQVTGVPEPTSLGLLGLGALAMLRRKR